MAFSLVIISSCESSIKKLCKKNKPLRKALEKSTVKVLKEPQHFKPLHHNFSGMRRVHVLKSFVLTFTIDEKKKTVTLLSFKHHDDVYRR